MWNVGGTTVNPRRFQPFEPVEVLYDFDGPRIFTLNDSEGELNLAYWSDEDDRVCRYVIVPTTPKIVASLRAGRISVFDALDQPRCWLCDVTHQGELSDCRRVSFEAVPRDSLPTIGTMLLPTLEPLPPRRVVSDEDIHGLHPGRPSESETIDFEGRIRELDKDRLSFELREISGTVHIQRFMFGEELLDEVFHAFEDDVRVRVTGKTFSAKNLAYALALSTATATEPSPADT